MGCSEIPSDCVNFATSPVSGRLCTCAMTLSFSALSNDSGNLRGKVTRGRGDQRTRRLEEETEDAYARRVLLLEQTLEGRFPFSSLTSRGAPEAIRYRTISACPFFAATCNGVCLLSVTLRSMASTTRIVSRPVPPASQAPCCPCECFSRTFTTCNRWLKRRRGGGKGSSRRRRRRRRMKEKEEKKKQEEKQEDEGRGGGEAGEREGGEGGGEGKRGRKCSTRQCGLAWRHHVWADSRQVSPSARLREPL
mmetsp:Transcript_12115/g.42191  ORF Transcript_12115/g.42191 Transcript_12115/m.42191 type:complete len:250 (+) Transcript_12115:89-838(+)